MILNLIIATICLLLEVCAMEICSLALRCSSSILKLFVYESLERNNQLTEQG